LIRGFYPTKVYPALAYAGDKKITPFWRVVDSSSKLARKLACGIDYIIQRQEIEGMDSHKLC